ncbi:TniQ family protein [Rhodoblastus sp.]|uniref:TniQ family protein n=1 Tax=Rhodoblastus sp. TaxID=1962975 RepID=UPI003F996CAE
MIEKLDHAKPLPVILKPVPDELLSSWLRRHATFYGLKQSEFLRHLLSDSAGRLLRVIDMQLPQSAAERLGRFLRCDQAEILRMTHWDLATEARWFVSPEPIQFCPACRSRALELGGQDAVLRGAQRGWRITCSLCGAKLSQLPKTGEDDWRGIGADVEIPTAIWEEAAEGERLLEQFLTKNDEAAAAAVATFRMLLVPRPHLPNAHPEQDYKLRAVDALLPGIDAFAAQNNIPCRWTNHVIAPLRIRSSLLAGFRRLLEKPRPRFHILRSVTLGHYRLRLETLGEQATPILGPLWFS